MENRKPGNDLGKSRKEFEQVWKSMRKLENMLGKSMEKNYENVWKLMKKLEKHKKHEKVWKKFEKVAPLERACARHEMNRLP